METWLTPTIMVIGGVASATVAGIWAWRNVRTGAKEQRAPSVDKAWQEADDARARMRIFEDLFYLVRGALRGLARRMAETYPDFELTKAERAALEAEPPPEKQPA